MLAAPVLAVLSLLAPPAEAGLLERRPAPSAATTAGTRGPAFTFKGRRCNLIAVPTALPVGALSGCEGVRPGAPLRTEVGVCTLNFLWKGSDGATYAGTAGHCILEGNAEKVWGPGAGPEARDAGGRRFGRFAYAVLRDPKDFALIRLDPGVSASPQMCHFGGPTGLNTEQPGALVPTPLHHYGQGLVVGTVLPARTEVALGMPDPDLVFANGLIVPGDSGSGAITSDGRAVGVVVGVGLGVSDFSIGPIVITRLAPRLARATEMTKVTYTLLTASTL